MANKIGVLRFNWLGQLNSIEELVDSWCPKGCKTEKDYENSLYRSLRKRLDEDIWITKQYGMGRTVVDIVIEEEVAIELKVNFKSTASLTRLLGQIDLMLNEFGKIVIVLCGEKDVELVKRLNEQLDAKRGFMGPYSNTVL